MYMVELWSLFIRQDSDFAMRPYRFDFLLNKSFQKPSWFAVVGGRVFFLVPHR
jgi:hypothetical protein